MADSIRVRTSHHDGITTVRSIIRHPMDTGLVPDPETGVVNPPHYIREVVCQHGDRTVLRCDWSRAVSRNPYLQFAFLGAAPGDIVSISWTDNLGESDTLSVRIA